ncbi:Auxin-induced protein 5NG4 [Hordeum vulgare]|nr:Auxin-induced protein 5NG4 [Hordeum vulgare]
MEFHGPTFQAPRTRPERMYPAGVVVENQLRVWAMSRWRGGREFAGLFLRALYRHLPVGTPQMFTINKSRMGGTGMIVRFRNPYDAYHLLGRVWFGGCEFICFTTYNIFTDLDSIWPNEHAMHTLPYNLPPADDEE